MESNGQTINFGRNHVNPILDINIFNQQYEKNLEENRVRQETCSKHKEELHSVRSHLEKLPDELTYDVMIPIGSQGLMRGKMVHTNEILALIGDGWYVKTSAKNAVDMCQRRIERCDEALNQLVKESELLQSWRDVSKNVLQPSQQNTREIFEDYDEEKEKNWRETHRENVRKHYLELAKLRNKENKTTIDDEETLQRRLDELEFQEEMEDELLRSGEDLDEVSSNSDGDIEQDGPSNKQENHETDCHNHSSASNGSKSRRVSFSEVVQEVDLEFEEEEKPEPLRILFHHSEVPVNSSKGDSDGFEPTSQCELGSPSDMYTHFSSLFPSKLTPKGILKQTRRCSSVEEADNSILSIPSQEYEPSPKSFALGMGDPDARYEEDDQSIHQAVAFGDVIVEHNPVMETQISEDFQVARPMSRFKASRQKQKSKET